MLEKFTKLYGQPVEGREVFSGDLSEMINIIIHSSGNQKSDLIFENYEERVRLIQ